MASIRSLSILALLAAVLLPVYNWLEKNLESFYIFDPKDLHDLANRAIAQHGNDTRAIVSYITTELSGRDHLTTFVNLDEEWVFNNAGGAMGAMYIIHASKWNSSAGDADVRLTEQRHHRVPDHLR
ncbi:ERG2/sigma1 receptor-like protein [Macrophomina phaseolina MS6]|uniref:C-8 sterol isomerase n=1 Tax=Macrophomina phaseolina (strain MS6) TaxID=1126212 RepID=K2S0J7_MACPH|nr:ERG2/sigma1 receptor-like protein [Macrophomina phaseolina MS6]